MHDRDLLQRFLFENLSIRGELVHLNAAWQEMLRRHEYPDTIQDILGEMAAAAVLLSSTLKFKGSLIMQIQGDGPLSMAVVESTSDRTLRGLAQWQGDVSSPDLLDLVGKGTLAVTIDPEVGERYQGIVDLSCGDIGMALEDYMLRSQQLETRLWLYTDETQSAGMLLQKMPGDNQPAKSNVINEDDDGWGRVTQLAATIDQEELTELSFSNVIYRLFHEEDVRIFDAEPVSFRCTCTRDRVRGMLRMLGYDEVKSVLDENAKVGVNCQFCNHYYEFDCVDVEALFATDIPSAGPDTKH